MPNFYADNDNLMSDDQLEALIAAQDEIYLTEIRAEYGENLTAEEIKALIFSKDDEREWREKFMPWLVEQVEAASEEARADPDALIEWLVPEDSWWGLSQDRAKREIRSWLEKMKDRPRFRWFLARLPN